MGETPENNKIIARRAN